MTPLLSQPLDALDHSPGAAQRAVTKARAAFRTWKNQPLRERAKLLDRFRRALGREAEPLTRLIAEENGKPVFEALGAELFGSLEALEGLVKHGPRWLAPEPVPLSLLDISRGVRRTTVFYEPIGVVGVIGTWNYPLLINLRQVMSALLCGNTVVWKPSELALRSAGELARLFRQAGFPEGAVTVVPGDGAVGEALIKAGCDKILFTGQGATGRKILKLLAEQGVPSLMELSGMDAALVLADCDFEKTVRGLVWGSMTNSGQSCVAARRIIIDQKIFPRFAEEFVRQVKKLRIGDPKDPGTEIGPVRTDKQLELLNQLIREAVAQGASLLTGGLRVPELGPLFVEPAVLTGLSASMRITQEEFFGPAALLFCAQDEKEMLELANRSVYALGASIWTRGTRRAGELARSLDAGIVWVNDVLLSAGDGRLPFGGVKSSGFGRIGGAEGLRQLTSVKTVQVSKPAGFRPYYFPYAKKRFQQLLKIIRWRYS